MNKILILFFGLLLCSCGEDIKKQEAHKVCIHAYYVNGMHRDRTYVLYGNEFLYVESYHGTYKLQAIHEEKFLGLRSDIGRPLETGVITYDKINCK